MGSLSIEILVIGLLMFGAVLHGVTGLGFPMISTMSVAIIFPLPTAIALVVLPNVFINLMVLAPTKNGTKEDGIIFFIQKFWILIISSVVGCIVGVILLKNLPMGWLYLLLSSATLFYVFYTFFNSKRKKIVPHVELENNTLKMLLLGGIAGVVGGATNAMSSILMMYLLTASDNKNEIVKTSNFCFLLAKIVQIILLKNELIGLDTRTLWALSIITILSIMALLIGIKIRDQISVGMFKKFVLVMLLVLSIRAGFNAFALL